MLRIRHETSGRSEVLGKPVVPRLRMAAWAGSTRHQEAIVAHCRRAHTELTRGQERAASEAYVTGFKERMAVDVMRACTYPSVCPQYDLRY